jgi:hypothetical protein
MTKLRKFNFALVLLAVAIYGGYSLRLHELLLNRDLVLVGGDLSWNIFAIKIGMQGNLDGISEILGWPYGYGLFAEPLLGTGPFYAAMLISKILFIQNIFIVYILTVISGMLTNTIAAYWMVSKEFVDKKYTYLFAFLIGITPFVLMRLGHMPILWLFFVPLVLGIYFRLERDQIGFKKAFLIVAFFGFWSPLFWLLIIIFLSLSLSVIYLILYKFYFKQLKIWTIILSGSAVSFVLNYFLIFLNREYKGETSRFPWQSNTFGGKFADILVSSPFVNSKTNLIEKLSEGLSPEGKNSFVGLIIGLGLLLTLIFAIANLPSKKLNLPIGFSGILVILWLFFATGGLGNLQAALLVLLDQTTPLRAWFRMIIVIGILGLYLMLKILEIAPLKNQLKYLISMFILLISIIDGQHISYIQYTEKSKVIEYSAVNFLDENTKNCGVLQVPVDTFPLIQDFTFSNGDKFGYNQTIPYLLSNNNKWSLYGIPGNKFWQNYKEIPTEITIEAANFYSNQGFCAILFDKDFSQWQIDRQAGLDFTEGRWPGLRINLGSPDFDNGRYQIYLLNK